MRHAHFSPRVFVTGLALALNTACGGAEPAEPPAPLPEGWAREDLEGDSRPSSQVIGNPAPSEPGTTPSARAAAQRDALYDALRSEWQETWSLEPGPVRAGRACRNRRRFEGLVVDWLAAALEAAASPQMRRAIEAECSELETSLAEFRDFCASDARGSEPELVEGSLESVGLEVERVTIEIRRLERQHRQRPQ